MNETYYLNLIEQNTDNTFRVADRIENEILNMKAIEYNTQAIIISGDTKNQEQLNQLNNNQVMLTMAIALLLLLNFIERCFK